MDLKSQAMASHPIRRLWHEFLPLSLSDVTMAIGDPLIVLTLANLPNAPLNLAAFGIAKAVAVFFESPIIMILHTSNALAASQRSRRVLFKFTLLLSFLLSSLLGLLALPSVFQMAGPFLFDIHGELLSASQVLLAFLVLWPFAIAWRRYFQGLLIHAGHRRAIAVAGMVRLAALGVLLVAGYQKQWNGAVVAGLALIGGVAAEAISVTIWAMLAQITRRISEGTKELPQTLKEVLKFYWPLANSMLVVWGGRALLVAIIARAQDGPLALAVWPAAWGLILVIANATRMVQQVIIGNQDRFPRKDLLGFIASVGCCFTAILLALALTPWGENIVSAFIGHDEKLFIHVREVLIIAALVPGIVAFQNGLQGFLISSGRTSHIYMATCLGSVLLLVTAYVFTKLNVSGSMAAAIAMLIALTAEVFFLSQGRRFLSFGSVRA